MLGGIPPDKQAEIQLVLQQRDTSTLKCYQDVLNDKHDRAFKGTVFVMLTIEPSGAGVGRQGGRRHPQQPRGWPVSGLEDKGVRVSGDPQ